MPDWCQWHSNDKTIKFQLSLFQVRPCEGGPTEPMKRHSHRVDQDLISGAESLTQSRKRGIEEPRIQGPIKWPHTKQTSQVSPVSEVKPTSKAVFRGSRPDKKHLSDVLSATNVFNVLVQMLSYHASSYGVRI